ncbi:MAG: glycoside hydrolase family 16 protein [Chitinophagaceae bacterium]
MRYLFRTMLVLLSLSAGCGKNKEDTRTAGYALVWADEFNYTGLPDNTKWNYDTGGNGWGNQELEYYTAGRTENARAENGLLIIEARKESFGGMNYTSARLVTKAKAEWQYGKIEVRAKLPSGRGTWPAIWMLGATSPLVWPDDGEADIMEQVGFDPGHVHASVHCNKYNHTNGTQKTNVTVVPDCSAAFHTYGMEWDRDSIRISVDDRIYFRFGNEHSGYAAWPFDNKMYLLLNIAVGGTWGGQQGVDDSAFPCRMEIDYVRMYQKK